MNKVTFTIPGNPMGKQRARTLKNGISYTPEKTVNYETLVKLAYNQLEDKPYFEGQVEIKIVAHYQIPKSTSKVKVDKMIRGVIRPTKKPDCDNIVKIICDALNGVAYRDDSQIVSCEIKKYYGDVPMVYVTLNGIN